MRNIVKITILITSISSSLSAHGQPDTVFGMSTLLTVMPTIYITEVSKEKTPKAQKELQAQKFIEENRENLELEVAKGNGENLDTLATLYGVENKESWKNNLQENYEEIFYKKDDKPKSSIEISGEISIFVEKRL